MVKLLPRVLEQEAEVVILTEKFGAP